MMAANTASVVSLCDVTNASGAKKLVDFAAANAGGQIRVLGIQRTPASGYTPSTDEFIDSDVITAMTNAKAFVASYFAAHTPLRIILAARVDDPTSGTIFTPNTADNNAVALAIGNTLGGAALTAAAAVSMGIILAKVAFTAPQVNIGRVLDGPLSISSWFIGILPTTPPASGGAWFETLNVLINAGYITCTTYPGKAGYFVSDDPMATSDADDYQSLANCRVIDKASILAYQSFLNYLNDDVDLVTGGTLDPAQAVDIQGTIANALGLGLSGNISGKPGVFVDTTQVLSAGQPFNVSIRVTPKGYLKDIDINLGFSF